MAARHKNKNKSRHRKHDNFKLPGIPQAGRRVQGLVKMGPSNYQNPVETPVETPAEVPAGTAAEVPATA